MKIAVIAAKGRVGAAIVKEAKSRGLDVTEINQDVYTLRTSDLTKFDVVVDAIGGWTQAKAPNIPNGAKHLVSVLAGSKTRLLVVGGAGSLFVDKEHKTTVAMLPTFPESFKLVASVHQEALNYLRTVKDVNWVYLSPAADFQAEGARTGSYLAGGEDYFVNDKGVSAISYADYAIAMVDEIVSSKHNQERFAVIGK